MRLACLVTSALLLATTPGYAQKRPAKPAKPTKPAKSEKTVAGQASKGPAATTPAEPVAEKPDLAVRPLPLQATPFAFPAFEEFTLDNGLHVYVVENHEQPVVTVGLVVRGGEAYDPAGREGTASLMGDLMQKGAGSRSAKAIAEALDGVGASVSVSMGGEALTMTGSALKKHAELLFGIVADEVIRPTFPSEELDKLRQQYAANIAYERAQPGELGQALARKVVYGMDNPLARRKTEQTVQSVTLDDIRSTHEQYMRPNNASIAIVGDVTVKEAKALLTKHFGDWKKRAITAPSFPDAKMAPAGVYFIPRKGAVQSMVIVSASAPPVSAQDYDATDLLCGYLASGFGSRFFATLRETYSYTYSPFGFVTSGRRYNRIAMGAEVRTPVTDSAINVMLSEIRTIGRMGPEEEALERRKAFEVGQYRLNMEQATFVAQLLQSAWLNEVAVDRVREQATRVEALTVADVHDAARRYMDMFNLRLVVVGDPQVRKKLEAFGPVYEFTTDIVPTSTADAFEAVSSSVQDVVTSYVQALGGTNAVRGLQSVRATGNVRMVMQGQTVQGTLVREVLQPGREHVLLDLSGTILQEQWVKDGRSWTALNGRSAAEDASEEAAAQIFDAQIIRGIGLADASRYTATVKGRKDGQIVIDATTSFGRKERYYFNTTTGLLDRVEKEEAGPNGPLIIIEKFDDYETVAGVKLPLTIVNDNSIYSLTMTMTYAVNVPLDDSTFTPRQ